MYVFIVNPVAGNGRGKRIFTKIMHSTLYKQINSRYFLTEYKGHAEEIVRDLMNNYSLDEIEAIIVVGGDGTLHGAINGIGNRNVPIAMIPSGSGNDFARGMSIHGKPLDILERILHKENQNPYWLGQYKTIEDNKQHFFVNNIGFGFDAEIARKANQSFYKRFFNILHVGRISYVIALIQVLFRFRPMDIELESNGENRVITDCWMITITNHPYYGGGMRIIPDSVIQPSLFPVLIIHSISKWKILMLFMTVFTGKHTTYKEIELFETEKMTISSKKDFHYQVDGETDVSTCCSLEKQSTGVQIIGAGKSTDVQSDSITNSEASTGN